jgi:transposase
METKITKPIHSYMFSEWVALWRNARRIYYKNKLKNKSKRQLAKELGVSRGTIIRLVNDDESTSSKNAARG